MRSINQIPSVSIILESWQIYLRYRRNQTVIETVLSQFEDAKRKYCFTHLNHCPKTRDNTALSGSNFVMKFKYYLMGSQSLIRTDYQSDNQIT